jgi:hypothetical protein
MAKIMGSLCRLGLDGTKEDTCTSLSWDWSLSEWFFSYFSFFVSSLHRYGLWALAAFYASWVIHSIGDWNKVEMDVNDEITPGQCSTSPII